MEKVLKTQNSRDNSTCYSLIESEVQLDGERALTYGIRIEGVISGKEEKSEILDITTSCEKAEILFRLIVRSEITPVTLKDVTEDFLNAQNVNSKLKKLKSLIILQIVKIQVLLDLNKKENKLYNNILIYLVFILEIKHYI